MLGFGGRLLREGDTGVEREVWELVLQRLEKGKQGQRL